MCMYVVIFEIQVEGINIGNYLHTCTCTCTYRKAVSSPDILGIGHSMSSRAA